MKIRSGAVRTFLSTVFLGVAACSQPGAVSPAASARGAPQQAEARPNMLFILIDDMGYGDLSITGNDLVETPNMDRLARNGLLMTQFTVAAPICSASRAGFLTGRFPARERFWNFIDSRAHNDATRQAHWLNPELPTLPRSLKAAGYATGHFGKWHMGGGRDIGEAPLPTEYGFDESYTQFEGLGPRVLMTEDDARLASRSEALGRGPIDHLPKGKITERYIDKALDFIDRHQDEPWYVTLWPDDVHDPWHPTEEQIAAVNGAGRSESEVRFLAVLSALDMEIGRMVDALRERGELDNTMIVLTSDNGPTGSPAYYKEGVVPGSAGEFRGRKGSLYEGGVREPLIVYWPGHIEPGQRDDTTVANAVDLYPTLADAADVPAPANLDGISLLPALEGDPIESRPDLYYAYGAFGDRSKFPRPYLERDQRPGFAIRAGDWKLLAAADGSDAELYNLQSDPGETRNMAAERPDIMNMLTPKLRRWSASLPVQASPREPQPAE